MTITDITAGDLIARAIAVVDDDIARLTATRAQLLAARESLTGVAPATVPASRATGATPSTATTLGSATVTSLTGRTASKTQKPRATRPAVPNLPTSRRTTPTAVDYHEVARVLLDASATGKPVRRALMDHFSARDTQVHNWITKVYALGLAPRPETSTTTPRTPTAEVTAAIDAVTAAEEGLAAL
jgi:hypothetical protein